jgi:prefoldin subunit 5
MEKDGLVSKPLALVVIGLILGASLGLGSGYAVFYPELVEQSNRDLEDKITSLEDSVGKVTAKVENMNESLSSIGDSLQSIVTLSQAINSLNTRIGEVEQEAIELNNTIRNTRNSLEDSIDDLGDDVEELNLRYDDLYGKWEDTSEKLEEVMSTLGSLNDRLQELDETLEKEEALEMLKRHLANQGTDTVSAMTDELFEALLGDSEFKEWVTSFGEVPAKSLLKQEIVRMTGSLVWYKVSTQSSGSLYYLVKVETFFEFEFSPASVSIPRMRMQIRAIVNVGGGELSQVQVDTVEIL